jgi:DNA (cytosine-5)-methyltransferase 1
VGGLSRQKAAYIKSIMKKVEADFGRPTLNALRRRSDEEVESYLLSLPGVGIKSARCVMMYALHREVFPADVNCLRVLERVGLIPWNGRRAETVADVAQEIVPAQLRRDLHVDLVQHGRAVCTLNSPRCGICCLADLCKYNQRKGRPDRPTVVDLCCGAGGFSWGFLQAGFRILLGIDVCGQALQTYAQNIPEATTLKLDVCDKGAVGQIHRALNRKRPRVVIAGPPCQGFSRAGSRDPDDPRNDVLKGAMKVAVRLKPDMIVFENVMNLKAKDFVHHLRRAEGVLRRAGYIFDHAGLHAQAFGVPQTRRRVVIIGLRKGLRQQLVRTLQTLTDRALNTGATVTAAFVGVPRNTSRSKLPNHQPMLHSVRVQKKIARIPVGGGPLSYRKLDPARPAQTLVCGHRALPCHYAAHRTITVREAARIQGFPDTFHFIGSKGQQMQQVANAVPPKLALGIGIAAGRLVRFKPQKSGNERLELITSRVNYRKEENLRKK